MRGEPNGSRENRSLTKALELHASPEQANDNEKKKKAWKVGEGGGGVAN